MSYYICSNCGLGIYPGSMHYCPVGTWQVPNPYPATYTIPYLAPREIAEEIVSILKEEKLVIKKPTKRLKRN